MNPSDALPQDFGLYYDACWMRHKTHGIGMVRVINGDMYLEYTKDRSGPLQVQPKLLECWWPRPGAFNVGNGAVYIGRRALRNMHKSAVCGEHYFTKWGMCSGVELMQLLRDGPNHVTVDEGLRLLATNKRKSVAVSRDVILTPTTTDGTETAVIFRGMEVGFLKNGVYEPAFSNSPLTGRVLRQLENRV